MIPLDYKTLLDTLASSVPPWVAVNRLFYAGDHWQGGTAYIGPRPKSTDAGAVEVLTEIQRQQVTSNVIAEVVDRHVAAVIGREPAWTHTVVRSLPTNEQPTAAEQVEIAATDALLTAWWDTHHAMASLHTALTLLVRDGGCVLRLFVPPAYVGDDGVIRRRDVAAALDVIWLDVVPIGGAFVGRDPTTMQPYSAYWYHDPDPDIDEDRFEVMSLDRQGNTVLTILNRDGMVQQTVLPLGGHLLTFELSQRALITAQIRSLQMALNNVLTMLNHNITLAGFVERVISNAEMPYDDVADSTAPGGKRRVYRPIEVGPGRTANLQGKPITDDRNRVTGYTSPSIQWRDPVPTETFAATDDMLYRRMLKEAHQLHASVTGAYAISGESRRQALADFLSSIEPTGIVLERCVRWLLETVYALARYVAGDPLGGPSSLRAVATARLFAGPLSSDDRQGIAHLYIQGMISHQTALSLLDIDDVDAELAQLAAERATRLTQDNATLATALRSVLRTEDA